MLNNVTIMGRLTADPEDRSTSVVSIARFAVACQRDYARQGEEKKTDFIDCVAFGKTADFVRNYFTKGQMISVTGRIQTDNYTASTGEKRKSVSIAVDNVYFAEPKSSSGHTTYTKSESYTEDDAPIDVGELEDLPF